MRISGDGMFRVEQCAGYNCLSSVMRVYNSFIFDPLSPVATHFMNRYPRSCCVFCTLPTHSLVTDYQQSCCKTKGAV